MPDNRNDLGKILKQRRGMIPLDGFPSVERGIFIQLPA